MPFLKRTCVEDYEISKTDPTIEKGVDVIIPVFAMHRDERYYPDPLRFDPERFNEINSAGKNQINRPYLPFGDGKGLFLVIYEISRTLNFHVCKFCFIQGPRHCIGMHLGNMLTKIGLLLMLKSFSYVIQPDDKNKEIEFSAEMLVLTPQNNICLRIVKRD